ncbi:uncharacterized protein LOC108108971 [Drosophila eugracilis]|uniref:uncharacterized protein LOC108108971 n=1 Tax=Drosophila eugracilis TaxID=29029 RepID=UPI0007E6D7C3|nr:uncharacterized protein LOC108108971 [Drosophila eugracilis]
MLTETTEAAYKRHKGIGPQVRQAYDKAIGQIFAELSSSDLEEFKVLYEKHENSDLDTETIINSTRSLMTKVVLEMNQCFFEGNDVENKLATLEMLKELFARYEGKDWNVNAAAPEELTRPLRMRSLDFSIHFMERQLEAQEKELEIAMAKSNANRERLKNVQDERVKLHVKIEEQLSLYREINQEINKEKL